MGELRAVTAFNVDCAEQVLSLFEHTNPGDVRPRAALNAARAFVQRGPRSRGQRSTAPAAHRAAKAAQPPACHAAMAAGDAAASAYLHPLADAVQVSHILRGPAYSVLALQQRVVAPLTRTEAMQRIRSRATPMVIAVLRRYPNARHARTAVASVIVELDAALRRDSRR